MTAFEFRTHPVGPRVTFCFVAYPGERAGGILRFLDACMFHAPEEVSPSDGSLPGGIYGCVKTATVRAGTVNFPVRVLWFAVFTTWSVPSACAGCRSWR